MDCKPSQPGQRFVGNNGTALLNPLQVSVLYRDNPSYLGTKKFT